MTPADDDPAPENHDADLTGAVRDTAYFLWEQDGRPVGRDDHYWRLALEQHLRTRAFDTWLREGRPEGRDQEHWLKVEEEISKKGK